MRLEKNGTMRVLTPTKIGSMKNHIAPWSAHVVSRYFAFGSPYAWSVPPMWAHAWLLLYGLFPFFMFGFLMTAGPNWLGAPKPSRAGFVPAAVGMAMGVVVFYIGLFTTREIAGTGLLLHAAGWIWGMGVLVRMVVRYWIASVCYALVLFVFLGVGAAVHPRASRRR